MHLLCCSPACTACIFLAGKAARLVVAENVLLNCCLKEEEVGVCLAVQRESDKKMTLIAETQTSRSWSVALFRARDAVVRRCKNNYQDYFVHLHKRDLV